MDSARSPIHAKLTLRKSYHWNHKLSNADYLRFPYIFNLVQYKFLCWLAGGIFKKIHILD
jgi:hypothetical protein